MFKKTLTAIIAATTLFGFNANSFAQPEQVSKPILIGESFGQDFKPILIGESFGQDSIPILIK